MNARDLDACVRRIETAADLLALRAGRTGDDGDAAIASALVDTARVLRALVRLPEVRNPLKNR